MSPWCFGAQVMPLCAAEPFKRHHDFLILKHPLAVVEGKAHWEYLPPHISPGTVHVPLWPAAFYGSVHGMVRLPFHGFSALLSVVFSFYISGARSLEQTSGLK